QFNDEAATSAEAWSGASVIGCPGRGGRPQQPVAFAAPESASVGPLALADVNGDGRLDLFVGARVVPGEWPLPAPSRLYLRKADGTWERDTANAGVLSSLGLISAAVFTD